MGKKLCTLLLALVIALAVAGCGGSADAPAADTPAAPAANPTVEPTGADGSPQSRGRVGDHRQRRKNGGQLHRFDVV